MTRRVETPVYTRADIRARIADLVRQGLPKLVARAYVMDMVRTESDLQPVDDTGQRVPAVRTL
jgi:hypothetical protein